MQVKFFPALVLPGVALIGSALADDAALAAYTGAFTASSEQFITITAGDGGLQIEGSATWGMGDPERVESGGVNIGEFSAFVPEDWIVDAGFSFAVGETTVPVSEADEYDCAIKMQFGPDHQWIDVKDNLMCGGHNVSFTGRYVPVEAD